jgi:hypothetical protein
MNIKYNECVSGLGLRIRDAKPMRRVAPSSVACLTYIFPHCLIKRTILGEEKRLNIKFVF